MKHFKSFSNDYCHCFAYPSVLFLYQGCFRYEAEVMEVNELKLRKAWVWVTVNRLQGLIFAIKAAARKTKLKPCQLGS